MYITAGPNGAGKTTASFTLLPQILGCREFVNADEIARGISPFNSESVAFAAGRIMLGRIEHLMQTHHPFAFETTLSTRSYVELINRCKEKSYKIILIFLWLDSPELAIERVLSRVKKGGHNIPEDVIKRRYRKGLENLVNLFMPLCDEWMIADNSSSTPKVIAKGIKSKTELITDPNTWNKILNYGNAGKQG